MVSGKRCCKERECYDTPVVRGYCNRHYQRAYRLGLLPRLRSRRGNDRVYTRDIRIRVTPEQWEMLTTKARAAHMDRASFVRDLIESA